MWSSARGKATYICHHLSACKGSDTTDPANVRVTRIVCQQVRAVRNWTQMARDNRMKLLQVAVQTKMLQRHTSQLQKMSSGYSKTSGAICFFKNYIHTGWHPSSEILELHDLVPVSSETLPDVSLRQLPAPLRSLRRWDDPLHPGPTARRPLVTSLAAKPDPGNTGKIYLGKQIGELEDAWMHMKMQIKWIDAEQNCDPSSQIMFRTLWWARPFLWWLFAQKWGCDS